MKKLFILLTVLFALSFGSRVMAQTDTAHVIFNAHLLEVLDISVFSGATQEITFGTAASYNTGVWAANGIVPGMSEVRVDATMNWDMTIECPDFQPYGANGGPGSIPIDNLGVWCEAIGTFTFNNQVNCLYTSAATSLGLDPIAAPLITNNNGNAGDFNENRYRLNWRMGTRDNGSMNTATMFDQMQLGTFGIGDYTTTAILTVTGL